MKVLITGAGGQLGWELQRTAPHDVELIALNRLELDIHDQTAVTAKVEAHAPDVIINTAAYTAVDKAEQEQALAHAINSEGVANVVKAAISAHARLIQISTDFAFDGAQGSPYRPGHDTHPLNVYGASKVGGEIAALKMPENMGLIVRASWLYSSHGNNFVKTMLRLMAEKEEIGVVADQIGTPTWAHDLAKVLWTMVDRAEMHGIHHWTNAGVASWYDFSIAIQDEGLEQGLLTRKIPIIPLGSHEYPTAAKRPAYSVLDCRKTWAALGEYAPQWRRSLRMMLGEMKNA